MQIGLSPIQPDKWTEIKKIHNQQFRSEFRAENIGIHFFTCEQSFNFEGLNFLQERRDDGSAVDPVGSAERLHHYPKIIQPQAHRAEHQGL